MRKILKINFGFVLIELIIVTAVIGLVSAIGSSALVKYNRTQRLQSATIGLETVLNVARSNSLSQVKNSSLCNSAQPLEGYKVVIKCSAYKLYVRCGGVDHEIMKKQKFPKNVELSNSSQMTVFFPVLKSQVIGSGTIPLTGHGQTRCIQVNPNGLISEPTTCPAPVECDD